MIKNLQKIVTGKYDTSVAPSLAKAQTLCN